MYQVGIRQGRLTPARSGRIRDFPSHAWSDELARARACGFETVEWLFAALEFERNPVWTDAGVDQIHAACREARLPVRSLCADYFLAHPFFRVSDAERLESVGVLSRLIASSARIGVQVLVVPVLDASGIRTSAEMEALRDSLDGPLAVAEGCGVRVGLETDLSGPDVRALVERRRHPALGVCYDTGNAAAQGHDLASDVHSLGPHLVHVHIKDRVRNGPSVPLGEGDADFTGFFQALAAVAYDGQTILEAPVEPEPMAAATRQLAFLRAQVDGPWLTTRLS